MIKRTKLSYIGDLQHYVTIKAENPESYLWSQLLKYRDTNFIKNFWPGQDDEVYRFIASSSYQAYEYYLASKTASIYTRPMLLYYSLLNLSKPILYFVSENRPQDYHGLCSFKFDDDFMKSEGKSNNGIFTELSECLGVKIPNKRPYSLEYFVKNIIELSEDFIGEFGNSSKLIPVSLNAQMGGVMNITISKQTGITIDDVNLNSNILDDFEIDSDDTWISLRSKKEYTYQEIESEGKTMLEKHLLFSIYPNSNAFINLNEPKENQLPQIVNYFGMLALLSNLVRYKPERIYEITTGAEDTHSWFMSRMCDVAERAFPNLLYSIACGKTIKIKNFS